MKFTVYGKPQGKARPRFSNGHAYTPKSTVDYEKKVKQAYLAVGGMDFGTDSVTISITAEFKKAKSNTMTEPSLKPDGDNIAKIILDALNGVAYSDDKQVIHHSVTKVWAADGIPKVVVEIERIVHPIG